jgi:hypothetical protein
MVTKLGNYANIVKNTAESAATSAANTVVNTASGLFPRGSDVVLQQKYDLQRLENEKKGGRRKTKKHKKRSTKSRKKKQTKKQRK